MPVSLIKYYKRSRKLILTSYDKLKDESKKDCDLMLHYNDDLRLAHYLKEWFYEICQSEKYSYQRSAFWDWVKTALNAVMERVSENPTPTIDIEPKKKLSLLSINA